MKRKMHKMGRNIPLTKFRFSSGLKPVKKDRPPPMVPWHERRELYIREHKIEKIGSDMVVYVLVNDEHLVKIVFDEANYNFMWPSQRFEEVKRRIREHEFEEVPYA